MKNLAMFAAATLLAAAPVMADDDAKASGYLGVRLQRLDSGLAEAMDLEEDGGVLLSDVIAGSAADKAGLEDGDVVVRVDGTKVGTPDDMRRAIQGKKAGEMVTLSYLRDGKTRTAKATLSEEKERPTDRVKRRVKEMRLEREHGWLGVQTQPLTGGLGAYFHAENGGALVAEVEDNSPAEKLGLKAGDVIVKVDDDAIEDPGDLRRAVSRFDEPTDVEVTWLRDGHQRSGKVELEIREGLAFLPDADNPGGRDFDWVPQMDERDMNGMRERVHAFRMGADAKTERALEELRQQIQNLKQELRELERKVD